jgi:hypothetical protein
VTDLARRQAELVAALTEGHPDPDGFDAARLDAVRRALGRKRAAAAATVWPLLAAGLGPDWTEFAATELRRRRPSTPLHDGWSVALSAMVAGRLTAAAARELAHYEEAYEYDPYTGVRPKVRTRLRALRHRLFGGQGQSDVTV